MTSQEESIDHLQQAILSIQQNIQDLDQKIEELANAGKYDEADKIQKKVIAEKQKLTEKRKEQINLEQQEKQIQLQTAFTQMAMKFQSEWDEEVKNFEIDCAAQIEDINARHADEMDALKETLDEEPRVPYKPSNELITLRTTEKQLAKLKKFQEAQRAKFLADQLESTERQRYSKEEDNRRDSLIKQLEQQQTNERTALLKKIERDRKEKSQQRESDNTRLEQRYRNLLRDQRNQQRQKTNEFEHNLLLVRRKEEGMYLTSPTPNLSRPLSGSTRSNGGSGGKTGLNGTGKFEGSGRTGSRPSSSSSSSPSSPAATANSRMLSSTVSSTNSLKGKTGNSPPSAKKT